MRFLRQSLTGLFLLFSTIGLLGYAGAMVFSAVQERMDAEAFAPQGRERVFSVSVAPAVSDTLTPELVAFGEVQSRRNLDIRAATGGTLVQLADNFVEGGRVTEGQFLAQIDPADAQSALDRVSNDILDSDSEKRDATSSLDIARDDLVAAREQSELRARALKRQVDLQARGVGTTATVEVAELSAAAARQQVLARRKTLAQAEVRVDQAATRLERNRIALADAKRHLQDTRFVAGFTGTLAEVNVVEGGLVSVNERLARLVDPKTLEVAFRISTTQYARLLNDAGALQKATVTASLDVVGVSLSASGRISRDSAAVGDGQTGRLLFATLLDSRGLKPGDFVTVRVQEAPLENVVRLPASAINSKNQILVLGNDNRLETLAVALLRRQGDDVLVRSPALAGREVVLQRTPLLGAGILIKPLRSNIKGVTPDAPAMIELSDERRAKMVAFVEANKRMPDEVKNRILGDLAKPKVPAQMVERIEGRMGG